MTASFRDAQALIALTELARGETLRIVNMPDDSELSTQLRALGLREGESIQLLRRAPLGGPLHLRTETGIEVAIGSPAASLVSGQRA